MPKPKKQAPECKWYVVGQESAYVLESSGVVIARVFQHEGYWAATVLQETILFVIEQDAKTAAEHCAQQTGYSPLRVPTYTPP